jgi:putative aldouronate transport system permease protein
MSIYYTAFGTAFSLALTIPAAYVLSKKYLPGRAAISSYFLFTMFFGGGLVPFYILVKEIGLYNTPLTLVILSGLSVYNMVVTRVFFETSIPNSLYEAAQMDGASEFYCFFRIALPLSAPIVSVMALFYGAANWNSYFNALIFLSDKNLFPLQLVLRSILILNQNALASIDLSTADIETLQSKARLAYMAEAMKYSLIFISAAPMLIAYPFVQKYFVKGVMIGSLKG